MKENYCTLYLVRHGETDYNKNKIVQGHLQIPLNEVGREQARNAAKKFSTVKIDAVYSSDLIRASETAEIIANEHKLEVTLSEALRERFLGRWQNKSGNNLPDELKRLLDQHNTLTTDEQWDKRPFEDYETNAELIARAFTQLRAIATSHAGQNVLVVTHGGVLRVLLAHLGHIPRAQIWQYKVTNTGVIELQSDGTTFIVKRVDGLIAKPTYE